MLGVFSQEIIECIVENFKEPGMLNMLLMCCHISWSFRCAAQRQIFAQVPLFLNAEHSTKNTNLMIALVSSHRLCAYVKSAFITLSSEECDTAKTSFRALPHFSSVTDLRLFAELDLSWGRMDDSVRNFIAGTIQRCTLRTLTITGILDLPSCILHSCEHVALLRLFRTEVSFNPTDTGSEMDLRASRGSLRKLSIYSKCPLTPALRFMLFDSSSPLSIANVTTIAYSVVDEKAAADLQTVVSHAGSSVQLLVIRMHTDGIKADIRQLKGLQQLTIHSFASAAVASLYALLQSAPDNLTLVEMTMRRIRDKTGWGAWADIDQLLGDNERFLFLRVALVEELVQGPETYRVYSSAQAHVRQVQVFFKRHMPRLIETSRLWIEMETHGRRRLVIPMKADGKRGAGGGKRGRRRGQAIAEAVKGAEGIE